MPGTPCCCLFLPASPPTCLPSRRPARVPRPPPCLPPTTPPSPPACLPARRVINADPTRSRVSVPFFYEANYEAVISPLAQFSGEG